jgi:hypothetical protein
MNAQDAIEAAYNQINNHAVFSYALQYYGASMGNLVCMINETYDSFVSSASPFFYWEFLYNNRAANVGIDSQKLNDGDSIAFAFVSYDPAAHAGTTLAHKNAVQRQATARP